MVIASVACKADRTVADGMDARPADRDRFLLDSLQRGEEDTGASHLDFRQDSDMHETYIWCDGSELPVPLVVLGVGASNSMQFAAKGEFAEIPLCHDSKQTDFQYDKSRWVVLLEALTGTFDGYWCKYDMREEPPADDFFAPIPHIAPQCPSENPDCQMADGLLDEYGAEARWLVAVSEAIITGGEDAAGGYSYGPDVLHPLYGEVNLGLRNASAAWGALVLPQGADSSENLQNQAIEVKNVLLGARPYLTRYIDAMLADFLYMFQTGPTLGVFDPGSGVGDPLLSCRARHIVLVVSHYPITFFPSQAFGTPSEIASDLANLGVLVHVIVLRFPETDMPAMEFNQWKAIAEAGGTGQPVVVDEADELKDKLEEVVQGILESPL